MSVLSCKVGELKGSLKVKLRQDKTDILDNIISI